MVIQTPIFGEIEIEEEKLITFEHGIPSFPEEKRFVFMELPETPFTVMQSVTSELYFFVINPFTFFKEYQVDIPDHIVEELEVKESQEVAIYNIVTIKEDLSQSTANMQAPIVVNANSRLGKQIILTYPLYAIRQQIFNKAGIKALTD